MALILTTDETQKVQEAAKLTRPTYYNAYFKKEIEISKDFEAVIILSSQSTRDSVTQWVNKSKNQNTQISDRDTLLSAFLDAEQSDAQSKLEELTKKVDDFSKFRDNFTESKFFEVPELGLMLNDLQFVMDETMTARDRAKHQVVMSTVLKTKLENNGITVDQKKEIESWSRPFLAY